jgi:hypothetical protein
LDWSGDAECHIFGKTKSINNQGIQVAKKSNRCSVHESRERLEETLEIVESRVDLPHCSLKFYALCLRGVHIFRGLTAGIALSPEPKFWTFKGYPTPVNLTFVLLGSKATILVLWDSFKFDQ